MGPLKGIKILDLTRLLPGPLCASYLTRLGATVVKIESGLGGIHGDYVRSLSPQVLSINNNGVEKQHSALFESLNAGKKSLAIDIKSPSGVALIKKLSKNFDVFIEGNRPGVMDRIGLGYNDLIKENPRLIYCSMSGYGHSGPMSKTAGLIISICLSYLCI
jgi:crotonobetainyl-CoA:carnitine CoA-transferase CaiB-like acyl-CoA transferase